MAAWWNLMFYCARLARAVVTLTDCSRRACGKSSPRMTARTDARRRPCITYTPRRSDNNADSGVKWQRKDWSSGTCVIYSSCNRYRPQVDWRLRLTCDDKTHTLTKEPSARGRVRVTTPRRNKSPSFYFESSFFSSCNLYQILFAFLGAAFYFRFCSTEFSPNFDLEKIKR